MSVIITDWNRHVYTTRSDQPAVVDRSSTVPSDRRKTEDGTKSFGSTADKSGGSRGLSSTIDWWNNAESDTLSDHSLADTDRDGSPIAAVVRKKAGKNEIVGSHIDWGALQGVSSVLNSPSFGLIPGPIVPGLVASDADFPVRIADRMLQSQMAARAPSSQTENDSFLSGSMSVRDIKSWMEKESQEDEKLANVLAEKLRESVHASDVVALKDQNWTRDIDSSFLYGSRPQMSVPDFLTRIAKYSAASPSCYLVSQIYIEKLQKKLPGLQLNSLTFQRLLLATTMMAAKVFDDFYHSNAVWAKIGGLTTQEINQIELKFLSLLDWNACVSLEDYNRVRLALISERDASPVSAVNMWLKDVVPPFPHSNPEMRFAANGSPHVQLQQHMPGPPTHAQSVPFSMPRTGSGNQLNQLAQFAGGTMGAPLQRIAQPHFHHQSGPGAASARPASLNLNRMVRSNSQPDMSGYNDPELVGGPPCLPSSVYQQPVFQVGGPNSMIHSNPGSDVHGYNDPDLFRGAPSRPSSAFQQQPPFQYGGPAQMPRQTSSGSSQGFPPGPSSVILSRPTSVGYGPGMAQPGPGWAGQFQQPPPMQALRRF